MEVQCSVLTLLLSSHSPASPSNLYCSTLCCSLLPWCIPFVFRLAHLFLLHFPSNSDTPFSSHFSLSVRQGTFYEATPPPVHACTAILHSLTLLNLELTFFTYMICGHAVIYKVSSAPLPKQSFFFLMWAGYLWVIKPVAVAKGAFIPWHRCESAHVSVRCWLTDPQSGLHSCGLLCPPAQFHARVLAFLCFLLPAESCGHLGFDTLAICPPALPLPRLKASISFLFLFNRAQSHIWWDLHCTIMLAGGDLKLKNCAKGCFFFSFFLTAIRLRLCQSYLIPDDAPLDDCSGALY